MRISAPVRSTFRHMVGIATVLAFASGAQGQTGTVVQGTCGSTFGAKVCTSYRIDAGKVTALIMRVPIALIEQAPPTVPVMGPPKADVEVPFAAAAEKQTGFTFSNVYWEPAGHPPAAFMVPHFDFHFYFAPEAMVQTIDCKNPKKPQTIPAGYSLPDVDVPHMGKVIGACIPGMGMHALPTTDLHRTTPWQGSLMVGYYNGKPLFIEPMITRALLLRKHSFSLPIPQIAPTPNVRYPKSFRAVYLPKIKAYDLTLLY